MNSTIPAILNLSRLPYTTQYTFLLLFNKKNFQNILPKKICSQSLDARETLKSLSFSTGEEKSLIVSLDP